MSQMIGSMAQMGGVDLGSSRYSFQMFFQTDDRREKHNLPHIHIMVHGDVGGVTLSLEPPFEILAKNSGEAVPIKVVKAAREYMRDNLGYLHFVWDMYTGQKDYLSEYVGDTLRQNTYRLRHNRENPTRAFG